MAIWLDSNSRIVVQGMTGSEGTKHTRRMVASGAQVVADGTEEGAFRVERVLWNDPGTGVMRHAHAGYDSAKQAAKSGGLDLPGITT